jgi:transcriptional regulator with XRE-family HTH domain
MTLEGNGEPDARLALILLRSLRKWDQAKLAQEARIAPSQLSVYERGDRAVPRHLLEKAAQAVGFPLYLLDPLLHAIASFRAAAAGRSRPGRAEGDALGAEILDLFQQAFDLVLSPLFHPKAEEDVDDLWLRLTRRTPEERRMLVEEAEEFRHPRLREKAEAESATLAETDPGLAQEWADLARRMAELGPLNNPYSRGQ